MCVLTVKIENLHYSVVCRCDMSVKVSGNWLMLGAVVTSVSEGVRNH